MDWQTETEKLVSGEGNWWKPTPGQHTIKFLDEGSERNMMWEGETIIKVDFKVEINNEEYTWSVTKGKTENSLYGQLVLVGSNRTALKGTNITLIVKGTGKNSEYTVMESLHLMKTKEERV